MEGNNVGSTLDMALIVVIVENKVEGNESYRAFKSPKKAKEYAVDTLKAIPYVKRIKSVVRDGTQFLYALDGGFEQGCARLQLVFLDETVGDLEEWFESPTVGDISEEE